MDFLTLTARDGATVSICHQGAHVCSWIPANGTEQLFLSNQSEFREGVAIRGGVPVIFPQFAGLGTLPKHGFARTAPWKLDQQGYADDVHEARLRGLQGTHYRDSLTGADRCPETAELLQILGETDRIYANVPNQLCLQQTRQHLHINTTGFADAVIWNPGPAGAVKLADMEDDGYLRMLCVEAAAIMRPIALAPGESWTGSQSFMVSKL